MVKGWSGFIRHKIKEFSLTDVVFTKRKELLPWLEKRNKSRLDILKKELFSLNDLVFVEKQEIEFKGAKEERFKCYFVYSGSRGRCYILRFNQKIKIITIFPLGRTTLRRCKKRFK